MHAHTEIKIYDFTQIGMTSKHMKRHLTVLVIREIQTETTIRYYYIAVKWLTFKDIKCWQEYRGREYLYADFRNAFPKRTVPPKQQQSSISYTVKSTT